MHSKLRPPARYAAVRRLGCALSWRAHLYVGGRSSGGRHPVRPCPSRLGNRLRREGNSNSMAGQLRTWQTLMTPTSSDRTFKSIESFAAPVKTRRLLAFLVAAKRIIRAAARENKRFGRRREFAIRSIATYAIALAQVFRLYDRFGPVSRLASCWGVCRDGAEPCLPSSRIPWPTAG